MTDTLHAEGILPFKSNFVEVFGHRMHYLDEGSGPVVVLLHGNPTWCFFFRHLVKSLCDKFRVIAPDYIGCGLSDRPRGVMFRAEDRVAQLEEFFRVLGVDRFSMVMHDWGGPIGTELVLKRISQVERLVYLNTTLSETETLPAIIKLAASAPFGRVLTQYTPAFLELTLRFGAVKQLSRETCRGYLAPYRGSERRAAIWHFVSDIPFTKDHPTYTKMLSMATRLPELSKIPVKLVWGLRDPCFHRGMLDKVARHFPHADILELPDASHLVLEDAPEAVSEAARAFLLAKGGQPKIKSKSGAGRSFATHEAEANPLYQAFEAHAKSQPNQDAVITPHLRMGELRCASLSYKQLAAQVNTYQRGLLELGLRPGDRVLFLVKPGSDFLALILAVMGRGAVPVLIDPGMGRENLFR